MEDALKIIGMLLLFPLIQCAFEFLVVPWLDDLDDDDEEDG